MRTSSFTTPCSGQLLDAGQARIAGLLHDPEVAIGERGHLRQVRDADHLRVPAQRPQLVAERTRREAADAGVDLVEHERLAPVRAARRQPQRERDARELSARRALR